MPRGQGLASEEKEVVSWQAAVQPAVTKTVEGTGVGSPRRGTFLAPSHNRVMKRINSRWSVPKPLRIRGESCGKTKGRYSGNIYCTSSEGGRCQALSAYKWMRP